VDSRATLPPRAASAEPSPGPARAAPAPAEPFVADDRGAISDPGRVVLIVEDDPAFAMVLRDLGRELSFQCVVAGDAAQALRLASAHRPAAVVLDIGLPDQSGLSVLELLKRDPSTRHVPIHVVSLHDYRRIALEMGAVGYALKPVKREELVSAFRVLEDRLSRKVKALLIVEDDPIQREGITALLAADGVEIIAVENADEALARLRGATFDCCVLDLMLPGASGFELLDRMSEDESCSFPAVIVYTARSLAADEEQRLRRLSKSIIIKGARSPERLLEEVTLFLHQVESDLPPEHQRMLRMARDREKIFDGRRVLLVEDDVRNIFALSRVLESEGLAVEIARNGKEALARLPAEPRVDLVLMDIMMPEMDGLEATREIRSTRERAALPIIALTAKAMPDDRQRCLAAGASDYIAKPIDVDKLLSLLRVWMPR
jgi:CheY-like chemotaxis protein